MKKTVERRQQVGREEDILKVIVDHHEVLRECIEPLKDQGSTEAQRRKSLSTFIPMLRLHAHAEQETLYEYIREIPNLKPSALEGVEEHDIAESLAMQLENMDYMNNWDEEITSKAKVLAELVEYHIDEEEKEFFPEVRRFTIPIELQILCDEYLVQCEQYLNQVLPQGLVPTLMRGAVVRVAQYVNRLNS